MTGSVRQSGTQRQLAATLTKLTAEELFVRLSVAYDPAAIRIGRLHFMRCVARSLAAADVDTLSDEHLLDHCRRELASSYSEFLKLNFPTAAPNLPTKAGLPPPADRKPGQISCSVRDTRTDVAMPTSRQNRRERKSKGISAN